MLLSPLLSNLASHITKLSTGSFTNAGLADSGDAGDQNRGGIFLSRAELDPGQSYDIGGFQASG